MGNTLDDFAKTAIGAQMSSEIDPKLYKSKSPRTNTHRKSNDSSSLRAPPSRRRTRSTSKETKYKNKSKHRDVSSKPRSKRYERKRKLSNCSTVSENDIKHSNKVVHHLVKMGYGTEKQIYAASALTNKHRDPNEVLKTLTIIQAKKPIKFKPQNHNNYNKYTYKNTKSNHKNITNNKKQQITKPTNNTTTNNTTNNNTITVPTHNANNASLLKLIDWINSTEITDAPTETSDKKNEKEKTISPKHAPEKVRSKSLSDAEADDGHILLIPAASPSFEHEEKEDDFYGEDDDNFMYTLDLNENKTDLNSTGDIPKFDPLPHSDQTGYKNKRLKKRKLQLRNSISATSMTTNLRKIEAMKNEIRESIESTLSEVSAVIEDEKDKPVNKLLGQMDLGSKSLYKVRDPPLLPARRDHLLYWNDLNRAIEFIVCCTGRNMFNSEYKSGIYLYDIGSFECHFLCEYPDKVYANSMGMAIDYDQHKLHLFGGKGLFGQWLILNLKAKIWDIRKDLSKYKIPFALKMEYIKCIVIDSSLHIYSCGRFLKYNRRKHKFIELENIQNGNIKNIKYIFYVKKQKRIYVIGNDCKDNIWYCQIGDAYHEYKWHKFNIKLPYSTDINEQKYNAILGIDIILFVFYYNRKQVCCINLDKGKIYFCTKNVNILNLGKSKLINTKTNMAHSLCMDHNGPTHTVVKLHDILLSTNMV